MCGIGLLVGAFRGYARWLVLPAAAFAAAGVVGGVAAEVGAGWGDLAGDRWIGIHRDMFEGPQSEVLAFGTIHVDIGDAPAGRAVVDAEVGVGEVRVTMPDDVTVEVRAEVDDGDVRVNDVARRDGTFVLGPEGAPEVIVHAQVERGSIEIEQYPRRDLPELPDEAIAIPAVGGRTALGELTEIADGVAGTADGWIVLLGGEAVIDPDDRVVVGPSTRVDSAVTAISTSYGEYRLLPRSILLGPTGEVLDLRAVRLALAQAGPATAKPARPPPTPPTRREADMPRHRFDPLSFALGLLAIGVAIAVIGGGVLDADRPTTGVWLAVGGLVLGLGLIPWTHTGRPTPPARPRPAARRRASGRRHRRAHSRIRLNG